MQGSARIHMFDRKTLLIALATMVILVYPATYIHELGHLSYCVSIGGLPSFYVDALIGSVDCTVPEGVEFDEFQFSIAGGLLSGLVVLVIPATYKQLMGKHHKGLLIGAGTVALAEFVNAILEGFATTWYLQNIESAVIALAVPALIAFVILVIIFGRRPLASAKKVVIRRKVSRKSLIKKARTAFYVLSLIAGTPIAGDSKQAKKWVKRQENLAKLKAYLIGTDNVTHMRKPDYIDRLAEYALGENRK